MNILLEIIKSHGVFDESGFTVDELFSFPNNIMFQYVSNAIAALNQIGIAHPDLREEISQTVNAVS